MAGGFSLYSPQPSFLFNTLHPAFLPESMYFSYVFFSKKL